MDSHAMAEFLERFASAWASRKSVIIAGVICLVAAFSFPDETISYGIGAVATSVSSDAMMRKSALARGTIAGAIPVVVIDIDDASMQAWGAGAMTPRKRIASLLKVLATTPAAAIVVDIDLTDAYDQSTQTMDVDLANAISTYPATAPRLLLTQPTRHAPSRDGVCGEEKDATLCPATFPSVGYQDVVAANPNVSWVTASFLPDEDRLLRRWRLWEVSCDGATGRALPSAALYVAALRENMAQPRDLLTPLLDSQVAEHCAQHAESKPLWPPRFRQFDEVPFLVGARDTTRADKVIPFMKKDGGSESRESARGFSYLRIPAQTFDDGAVSPAIFDRRVVLIGATHRWSRDVQATPSGEMPGVVVVANAIVGFAAIADRPPPSWIAQRTAALITGALFIALTLFLRPMFAALAIGAIGLLIITLLAVSFDDSTAISVLRSAFVLLAAFLVLQTLIELALDFRKGEWWRIVIKPSHHVEGGRKE